MYGKKIGADLSRKDFLKLGGAGLAGAALLGTAGCGGGGSGSGDLTLSWAPDDTGSLQALIKKFNKQSKDFKVKYQEMPADTGQYFDKLRTQFQAGGGDIDLILGDVIWPAQFAVNGWVADLSDRIKDTDEFLPGPIEAATYDGKVWAVPWYTDAGLLYYRKDLLEKSGYSEPPATWAELQEMAAKVMKDQGIENGFVFQGDEYEGGVCNGCEYIWSYGGNILDPEDPTKVIIDSPEAAAVLAEERSMIAKGTSPQGVLQYQESETEGAFLTGSAVFMRIWPSTYALAGTTDFPDVKKDMLGITQIPTDKAGDPSYSTLGGWNFLINAQSDLQDEAWEFAKWMTEPEQLISNAKVGSKLPVRQSLYDDPEVLDNVPVARLGKEAIIDNSRPRPVSPYYSDVSLELAEGLNTSLSGDTSPEDTVANLQKDLQQIIDQGEQAAG
ncbi:MAG: ABC transporter substrate-binding protein [Rubrobacteraceae bacterium]|nr:ABC transporter substrate-binding protein [Rubrobacteraceae bacterium]